MKSELTMDLNIKQIKTTNNRYLNGTFKLVVLKERYNRYLKGNFKFEIKKELSKSNLKDNFKNGV